MKNDLLKILEEVYESAWGSKAGERLAEKAQAILDILTPEPVTVEWVKFANNSGCHAKIGAFELMVLYYEGDVFKWDVRYKNNILVAIERDTSTDRPTAQAAVIAAYIDLQGAMRPIGTQHD